jgi:hypothetical protein
MTKQCHTLCWLLRNQHLHGIDPNNNITSYKHLHLLAQIQELYDATPHMMWNDRDLFAFHREWLPMCSLQSTATLPSFYHHAKPIVEQSIKDAQKLGKNFHRIDNHTSSPSLAVGLTPVPPLQIFFYPFSVSVETSHPIRHSSAPGS